MMPSIKTVLLATGVFALLVGAAPAKFALFASPAFADDSKDHGDKGDKDSGTHETEKDSSGDK